MTPALLTALASPYVSEEDILELRTALNEESTAWSNALRAASNTNQVKKKILRRVLDRIPADLLEALH